MVNKFIGIGNLGRDPELKFGTDGKAICKFPMAMSERWTDKDGQKQERVEWVNVVVFGKQAEPCGQYLAKGRQVYIEGSIRTRTYDKDGQKHYMTEIVARDVKFLGGGVQKPSDDSEDEAPF